MKRSQESSPTSQDSHKQKKAKILSPASNDDGDDEGWTKVEKRKQKKAKKTETKNSNQPKFMYANSEIIKRHRAIGIEEIRELALHLIADAPPPNWLMVEGAASIPKVVALLIPGLTSELLSLPPLPTSATLNPHLPLSIPLPTVQKPGLTTTVPFIASTFSHACPTRAPGDQTRMHSVLSAFFSGPISGTEKKRRMELREASERAHDKDPTQYLLTLEQMIENDYPIPSYMADVFQKPQGWVETPEEPKEALLTLMEPKKSGVPRQIYAIDCEMCLTEDGKELTRICIIDFRSGNVLYDQLVKPQKPVKDYLTRWSGITEAHLASVTTTLAEVQAHVLRIVSPPAANPFSTGPSPPPPPTPILLGHSLESDLKAMKLCHPYCIDTAVIYHHPRGRPLKPGLAWLTKKWCGREIQTGGDGGHDPREDAQACLQLLQKKLENGPSFGEFMIDFESIFERMSRSPRRAGGPAGSIKTAVIDHGNPGVMHGSKASTCIACKDDDEVLKGLLDVLPSHHFAFGRFMALANLLGWTTPKTSQDSPPLEPVPPPTPEALSSTLVALNAHLKTLHAALPSRTAIVIFTGHSDPRRMAQLNARKSAFETAVKSGRPSTELGPDERWTSSHVRELEEAVELAKRGLLFLGVKA